MRATGAPDRFPTSIDLLDGGVATSDLADGAVTAGKLGVAPAVSVLNTYFETSASGTSTGLHADFEIFDTAGLHAAGSEYLTAPVTGTYVVSASVEWYPNSAGYRQTSINGPWGTFALVAGPALPGPDHTRKNASGVEKMTAGQTVRVEGKQGSGGDLGVRLHRFQMTLVGG